MKTLQQRVEELFRSISGFEEIDSLLTNQNFPGKKRADYLLLSRSVIIEQKVLTKDPTEKPGKFVTELMERGEFVVYGEMSTHEIFAKHPQGELRYRKMIQRVVNVISGDIEKADKQTRDTRDIFAVPNALGIVTLINESAPMLDLELVGFAANEVFKKLDSTGKQQYSNNAAVILISNYQTCPAPFDYLPLIAVITNRIDAATKYKLDQFSAHLCSQWDLLNRV